METYLCIVFSIVAVVGVAVAVAAAVAEAEAEAEAVGVAGVAVEVVEVVQVVLDAILGILGTMTVDMTAGTTVDTIEVAVNAMTTGTTTDHTGEYVRFSMVVPQNDNKKLIVLKKYIPIFFYTLLKCVHFMFICLVPEGALRPLTTEGRTGLGPDRDPILLVSPFE